MRWLPPFIVGTHRLLLPLSAATARRLCLAVVADASERNSRLCEALRRDPVFCFWSWLTCQPPTDGQDFASNPNDPYDDLATGLGGELLAARQWPDESLSEEQADRWSKTVEHANLIAELAAAIIASAAPEQATVARFRGMLGGMTVQTRDEAPIAAPLGPSRPVTEAVAAAIRFVIEGASLPEAVTPVVDSARASATGMLREWLSGDEAFGALLPRLLQQRGEIAAVKAEYAATLQREKLEALAEFAAGAGHEINNPLTIIAGRAQLLLRETTDPEHRHALALMNVQAMRVYEMIADLMLFARPPQPDRRPIDLAAFMGDLAAEVQPLAARQETELAVSVGATAGSLVADSVQLAAAARAIVQNSLEALGRGGRIDVRATNEGHDVRIAVSDNGPGIKPAERRHLFDPFYSARQAGRGLGMGLSKAWRIVLNHGGRIDVDSAPGRGARFTIVLPQPTEAPA